MTEPREPGTNPGDEPQDDILPGGTPEERPPYAETDYRAPQDPDQPDRVEVDDELAGADQPRTVDGSTTEMDRQRDAAEGL